MIQGEFSIDRVPIIPLRLQAPGNRYLALTVFVDTGFTGYLALPLETVLDLDLPLIGSRPFLLADEREQDFMTYAVIIEWLGESRAIEVLASEGTPNIGTGLLYGSHLFVDVVDGGEVRIEARKGTERTEQ